MLFATPTFLVFLLCVFATLAVVRRSTGRKIVMLAASYVFYGWWDPRFLLLLLASTSFDYCVGLWLERATSPGRRRALLVASLCANLGLLGFFKYGSFLEGNLQSLLGLVGHRPDWVTLHIVLPVGISFYTFHTMSYVIDVYRRVIPASRSPVDFALAIAFFPQLVAGPIVRASEFLPQIARPVRLRFDQRTFFLIVRGLAKKVLIADNVGRLADVTFDSKRAWPSALVWLATICFSVQIYCDFSGYSDVAIGLSRIFGIQLKPNFDRPYFAAEPSEFWRKWHISLSSWLRDYLYIPLGGNRGGTWKTYRNLMLTMLLGGLWHGASWNFVLWGAFHGVLLAVHRAYGVWRGPGPAAKGWRRVVAIAAMQYCVLVSWILFRVRDPGVLVGDVKSFIIPDFNLALDSLGLGNMNVFSTALLLGVFGALHVASWLWGGFDERLGRMRLVPAAASCVIIGVVFVYLWPLKGAPFIYFQF